jgi:ATP-binding cassette subfamily C (CFTR/MRP) protein 4
MPNTLNETISVFLTLIGLLILSIWANWLSVILAVPLIFFLVWLRNYYLKTAREIKRLDGVLRSPVYNHVSTTMIGLSSVKAFNLEEYATKQFEYVQGNYLSAKNFLISKNTSDLIGPRMRINL